MPENKPGPSPTSVPGAVVPLPGDAPATPTTVTIPPATTAKSESKKTSDKEAAAKKVESCQKTLDEANEAVRKAHADLMAAQKEAASLA